MYPTISPVPSGNSVFFRVITHSWFNVESKEEERERKKEPRLND